MQEYLFANSEMTELAAPAVAGSGMRAFADSLEKKSHRVSEKKKSITAASFVRRYLTGESQSLSVLLVKLHYRGFSKTQVLSLLQVAERDGLAVNYLDRKFPPARLVYATRKGLA